MGHWSMSPKTKQGSQVGPAVYLRLLRRLEQRIPPLRVSSHALHPKCHLSPCTRQASLHPGHGEFGEHGPTLHPASGLPELCCMPTSTWAPGKWRVNPPSSQFLKVLCRPGRRQNWNHYWKVRDRCMICVCLCMCVCIQAMIS